MNPPNQPDSPLTHPSEDDAPAVSPDAAVTPRPAPDLELTGDAVLDARLAEPVFQGYRGIETAQFLMSAFLIAVVGVLAYCNSLGGDFVGEDRDLIVENTALHRLSTLPEAVRSGSPGPLATALLSLNWLFTPASAAGFQVVNVVLHVLNAILLFAVARTLLRSRTSEAVCMTAGILLAVLPAATVSVDYFVGRAGLMATTCACLALLFAWRATAEPDRIRSGAMLLSVIFHLAAAACAAQAILLPIVTIGYVWTARGPEHMRAFAPWAGGLLFLQCASIIVLTSMMRPIPGRVIAVPSFIASALIHLVFPFRLSIAHGVPFYSYVVTFVVLLFSGSFVLALLVLRRRPGVPLLWFGLCALGSAVVTPAGDLLGGRHAYLPVAGLMLLVPWALTRLPAGGARVAGGIVVAVATLVSGWITLHRNDVWNDPVTLWAEAADLYPESFEPRHRLGRYYVSQGHQLQFAAGQTGDAAQADLMRTEAQAQYRQAIDMLEDAVALGDPHADTHLLLAEAHLELGAGVEAEKALLDALAMDPMNAEATLNLASMLEAQATSQNDPKAAARGLAYYERANELRPLTPERLARYGMLLASVGRFEDAAMVLAQAVEGQTSSPYAEAFQGVQDKVKQLYELDQYSAEKMRANPADPEGLRTRAQAQLIRGNYLDASYVLERLLKQYPQDYNTWMLLGMARAKMGGADQFVVQHAPAPASAEGSVVSPWQDLAERCAGMNSWDAARIYLAQATELPAMERSLIEARWALGQGQMAAAESAIAAAKEAGGGDPRPWLIEVDLALATGRVDAAEAALEEAKRLGAEAAEVETRTQRVQHVKAALSRGQSPPETGS